MASMSQTSHIVWAMGCHPVIHHYSRKGMPSLEYLGMAGSSPGDSCCPAAASTGTHCSAEVHSGGGWESQGEGAERTVLWEVDRLPQQAANIIRAGEADSSLQGPYCSQGLWVSLGVWITLTISLLAHRMALGRQGHAWDTAITWGEQRWPTQWPIPMSCNGRTVQDYHVRIFINKKSYNNLFPLSHKGLSIKSSGFLG